MAGLSIADEEALEALKAYWDATNDLQSIAGALRTGEQRTAGTTQPYAIATSEKNKDQKWYAPIQSGSPYQDYRKITITAYGDRTAMVALAKACMARLAWLPRKDADGTQMQLAFPAGTTLKTLMPLDDPHLVEDKTQKAGKPVWRCEALYELWTTRHLP
jgi:hypothetical protein